MKKSQPKKPIFSERRRRQLKAIFAKLRAIERASLTGAVSQRKATKAYERRQRIIQLLNQEKKRKKALQASKKKYPGLAQYRGAIKWIGDR